MVILAKKPQTIKRFKNEYLKQKSTLGKKVLASIFELWASFIKNH